MQELRDKLFDADIVRTLRFDTVVTPAQRQYAKRELLRLAAEQTMLPPLTVSEERAGFRSHAYTLGQHTLRFLQLLLVDASVYERARRPPRHYQYYNAHGRYAYTIIRMSA